MDLLILLKCFLILGSICYLIFVYMFISRHMPKISFKKNKKEEENKEGLNNDKGNEG